MIALSSAIVHPLEVGDALLWRQGQELLAGEISGRVLPAAEP